MATAEHVSIVKQGAEALKKWRAENQTLQLDLSHTDLAEFNLAGEDLSDADLSRADLTGANLRDANLMGANLTRTDLTMAHLAGACLAGVTLYRATFTAADLKGADFTGARFGFTCVSDCDMSLAVGLDTAEHLVPSSIGIDTLTRTLRTNNGRFTKQISIFFRRAGVSAECLKELPSIVKATKYCSCFIAFGGPDQGFAARLDQSLGKKGIERWFFPKDAVAGQPTLEEERRARKNADKVIVVCSGAGLGQAGLLREIDETAQENPKKLIPILKDTAWLHQSYHIRRDDHDLKPYLQSTVWVDFSSKKYREALRGLVAALSKS